MSGKVRMNPLKGGILFLIYLGKVSFSGEVGGYPQALLKVVNLQAMLNFHRNFHLSKNNQMQF